MSLDDRDYMNEPDPYKLPDEVKEGRLREMRDRFEAATPRTRSKGLNFEFPFPESRAGFWAVIAIGAAAITIPIILLLTKFT